VGSTARTRRARIALCCCLALIAVSALLLQSVAAGPTKSRLVPQEARFYLRGTNGYLIRVSAEPKPPQSKSVVTIGLPSVTLSAMHEHQEVVYETRAAATLTAIDASFGRLGTISVSFIPSGKVLRARRPKRCRMGRFLPAIAETRLGVFVGTISFHDEHGYTVVHAKRAKGGVGDGPMRPHEKITRGRTISSTETPKPSEPQLPRRVSLDVGSPHSARGVLVNPLPVGLSKTSTKEYSFEGFTNERRGRIRISHYVSVLGPASDFNFNSSLTSATVTPPAPFFGTASFQREADSTSWAGSLSGPLPARGIVQLAGPRFSGELLTE
jgi:hypothetical protein